MANLELIAPQKVATFSFSLEPAYNAICSLCLLNEDLDNISEWVTQTVAILTKEQLQTNKLVCGISSHYLGGKEWPSFPAWLDDLAQRDPVEMRDHQITHLLSSAADYLNLPSAQLPSPEEILDNRDAYLQIYQRLYEKKGHPMDEENHIKEHELYQEPSRAKELVLSHMRFMWQEHLQAEWQRNLTTLNDSITAFNSLDFSGMSTEEVIRQISGRDQLPQIWDDWIANAKEVIMIPSAHIGPYLMTVDKRDDVVRLVVRAHIPEGASVSSPSLNRSELLMRISALSNDTRLQILTLLNEQGELNANDIQQALDLTQSATSRHIRQLHATGYLHHRRLEGTKHYRVNPGRINDTADALVRFLSKPGSR
jgi:ArsR family transcriptional regulator